MCSFTFLPKGRNLHSVKLLIASSDIQKAHGTVLPGGQYHFRMEVKDQMNFPLYCPGISHHLARSWPHLTFIQLHFTVTATISKTQSHSTGPHRSPPAINLASAGIYWTSIYHEDLHPSKGMVIPISRGVYHN